MKNLILALSLIFIAAPALAADKETAYDRIMKSGEIRCGYFTWAPYFMVDPNTGEKSGVFYDYTEELGKLLGLKINWVGEMNFGTFLQDIADGRFDMECTGGWPNAQRGKHAIYTKPIYYIPVVPFVRSDETRFTTIDAINNSAVKIADIDGENAQTIRNIHFPLTQELSLPQTASGTQMLMNVATNKADVTFTDIYSGQEFIAHNKDSLKPLFVDKPLQLFAQNMTVGPEDFRLREMINIATDDLLLTGKIDHILDKYEAYPGSFYRLSPPYEVPQ